MFESIASVMKPVIKRSKEKRSIKKMRELEVLFASKKGEVEKDLDFALQLRYGILSLYLSLFVCMCACAHRPCSFSDCLALTGPITTLVVGMRVYVIVRACECVHVCRVLVDSLLLALHCRKMKRRNALMSESVCARACVCVCACACVHWPCSVSFSSDFTEQDTVLPC